MPDLIPAVQQDRWLRSDRFADRDQCIERGERVVDLPTSVIGHDDRVDTKLYRLARVIGMEDPFEHNRQGRAMPKCRQVIPGQSRVGVNIEKRLNRCPWLCRSQILAEWP